MTGGSVLARLFAEPWRFGFDAAVRLLMRARRQPDPGEAVRFRTIPGMAYPPADIARATPGQPPEIGVTMAGLTGPSGVLPRFFTEQVVQQARARSEGLHRFLDMLGHRMIAAFAQAGIKYRPARSAEQTALGQGTDPHRGVLLALVGEAELALSRPDRENDRPENDRREQDTMLFYAGLFTAWPRSADRLEAMLSEWMGQTVSVLQFQGAWLALPVSERSRLPKGRARGQFNRLGHDAAVGERSWDPHGRVVIRIDQMSLDTFRTLQPDRPDAVRLLGLVRAYLGPAIDCAINPVLRRDQVPGCALGAGGRLGWDTWLAATPRRRGGDEARFPAGLIERKQAGRA